MSNELTPNIYPPRSVNARVLGLCKIFWPQLATVTPERQVLGVGEVISTLYTAPFAIAGVIWLLLVTDWFWLRANLPIFALFAVLIYAFNQFNLFLSGSCLYFFSLEMAE